MIFLNVWEPSDLDKHMGEWLRYSIQMTRWGMHTCERNKWQ